MAKIRKVPPKRLSAPLPSIKVLLRRLLAASNAAPTNADTADDHFLQLLPTEEWSLPKADLYHFIPILNRLDDIMASILSVCQFQDGIQLTPFTGDQKRRLLIVLRFTRLLLENSTNRNVYNSYEHLNALLGCRDLDVLEANLRLLLRPVQRMRVQRSLKQSIDLPLPTVLSMISAWGLRENGYQLTQFLSSESVGTTPLQYKYYRSSKSTKSSKDAEQQQQQQQQQKSSSSSSVAMSSSSDPSGKPAFEGLVTIPVQGPPAGQDDRDAWRDMVQQFDVPDDKALTLYHFVRLAACRDSPEQRRKILKCRLLAMAIFAHASPESQADSQFFVNEPHLMSDLVDLLQIEKKIPFDVQACALCCLEALSQHRTKLGEVLTAINAAANHGILMFILRRVIANLDSDNLEYTPDFIDALFSFLSQLLMSQSGGNMIIGAGVIPVLVQLLDNKRPFACKYISRSLSLLDSSLYGFGHSLQSFFDANGLTRIVDRIKDELEVCLSLNSSHSSKSTGSSGEKMEITSPKSPTSQIPEVVPYDRLSLFKSLMRFCLHAMQSSSASDRVRNLIESSLPNSIKEILEHPKLFGNSIYALALNIMATFIHNEPTSYMVLQEKHVPQAFLNTICAEVPASADVLNAIPEALGAICLNQSGLEKVLEVKPLTNFFAIFHSPEYLRSLIDEDMSSFLGNAIDELVRHHPQLKPLIMEAVIKMLYKIIEIGQSENDSSVGDEKERAKLSYRLFTGSAMDGDVKMVDAETKPEEAKEAPISQYIEVATRFLEGMFQNPANCKEFLDLDGMAVLFKIYKLPTLPYDFASLSPSYSLSHLFRAMSDTDAVKVLTQVLKEVNESFERAKKFLDYPEKKSLLAQYVDLNDDDLDKFSEANQVFRSFVELHTFTGLLCDVYSAPVFSNARVAGDIIKTFAEADGERLLENISHLYRVCAIESLWFKQVIPRPWIYSKQKKAANNTNQEANKNATGQRRTADLESVTPIIPSRSQPNLADAQKKEAESQEKAKAAAELIADPNDRRVKNTRMFKYLLSQTTAFIVPMLQGLARILLPKRHGSTDREHAFTVATAIAKGLCAHITWPRAPKDKTAVQYHYLHICAALVETAITDERNQRMLLTIMALVFYNLGGVNVICDTLMDILKDGQQLSLSVPRGAIEKQQKEPPLPATDPIEIMTKLQNALENILTVLLLYVNSASLHESHHTATLSSKDRSLFDRFSQKSATQYSIDPNAFLVEARLTVIERLKDVWNNEDSLKWWRPVCVKTIFQMMIQILRAQGETEVEKKDKPKTEGASSSAGSSTNPQVNPLLSVLDRLASGVAPQPLAPTRPEPSDAHISMLTEMGFSRDAAISALIRCNENVMRAAEYLLTHPTPDPQFGGSASSSTTAAAPTTQSETVPQPSTATEGATASNTTGPTDMDTEQNEVVSDDGDENYEDVDEDDDDDDEDEEEDFDEDDEDDYEMDGEEEEGRFASGFMKRVAELSKLSKKKPDSEGDEKEKAEKEARRKKLDGERETLKKGLIKRSIGIAEFIPEAVFDIKDIWIELYKPQPLEMVEEMLSGLAIQETVSSFLDGNLDADVERDVIGSRLHLLALMCCDPNLQPSILYDCKSVFGVLLALFLSSPSVIVEKLTDGPSARWKSAALLLLEAFLLVSETPNYTLLTAEVEAALTNDEKIEANASKRNESETEISPLSPMQTSTLIKNLLQVVNQDELSPISPVARKESSTTLKQSIFRLLVRLTRTPEGAMAFVEQDGIELMVKNTEQALDWFPGKLQNILLIFRHVVESLGSSESKEKTVLRILMEMDIINWLSNASNKTIRGRKVDWAVFWKQLRPVCARNPLIFVEAAKSCCRIQLDSPDAKIASSVRLSIISSQNSLEEAKKFDSESKAAADVSDSTKAEAKKPNFDDQLLESYTSSLKESFSAIVSESAAAKRTLDSLLNALFECSIQPPSSISDTVSCSMASLVSDNPESGNQLKVALVQQYQCFLLQSLAEFLESFPPCQVFVRKWSKDSHGVSDWIIRMCREFLPYPGLLDGRPSDSLNKKEPPARVWHRKRSMWTMQVMLFMFASGIEMKSDMPDMVVECIGKLLESSLESKSMELHEKYTLFVALFDLIQKILLASPSSGSHTNGSVNDANVLQKAITEPWVKKIPLMTRVFGSLELEFPNIRTVVLAIIKPLDMLIHRSNKFSIEEQQKKMDLITSEEAIKALVEEAAKQKKRSLLDFVRYVKNGTGGSTAESGFIRDSALNMFSTTVLPMYDDDDSSGMSEDESDNSGMDDDDDVVMMMEPMELDMHGNMAGEFDSEGEDQSGTEDDDLMEDDEDGELDRHDFTDHSDEETEESGNDDDGELEVVVRHTYMDSENEDENSASDDPARPHELMVAHHHHHHHHDDEEEDEGEGSQEDDELEDEEDHEEDEEGDEEGEMDEDDMESDGYDEDGMEFVDGLHDFGDILGADNDFDFVSQHRFESRPLGIPLRMRSPRRGDFGANWMDHLEIHVGDDMRPPVVLDDLLVSVGNQPMSSSHIGGARSAETHPLLQRSWQPQQAGNNGASSSAQNGLSERSSGNNGPIIDRILSGNAFEVLEQILQAAAQGAQSGQWPEMAAITIPTHPAEQEAIPFPLPRLSSQQQSKNMERWLQELRLASGMTGSGVPISPKILLLESLIPLWKEFAAWKIKRLEEIRLEKEVKDREERERKAKEQEEARKKQAEEAAASSNTKMDVETSQSDANAQTSTAGTMYGGVDLVNAGIDPTFLEALPEDLRAEVLAQHLQEQQIAHRGPMAMFSGNMADMFNNMFSDAINPEFLDALPAGLRDDLVGGSSRQRGPSTNATGSGAATTGTNAATEADKAAAEKVKKPKIYPQPCMDAPSLQQLLAILFLPKDQAIPKQVFTSFISHVCENSDVRAHMISLLLSLVISGAAGPKASEKKREGKAKAGHHNSSQNPLVSPIKRSSMSSLLGHVPIAQSQGIPVWVLQRVLDLLVELAIRMPGEVDTFFLEETVFPMRSYSDTVVSPIQFQQKIPVFPIVYLLSLLKQPIFLQESGLMETLTMLISIVTKPLSQTRRKREGEDGETEGNTGRTQRRDDAAIGGDLLSIIGASVDSL